MKFQHSLLNEISRSLKNTRESISVAESVTSGYLQFSFSQMKDASEFYKGGLTAYTLEEKVNLLNVDKTEAEKVDCVSQNIADQMAFNVAKLFNSDWGIAVTGYATPVAESQCKIFAYFTIVFKNKVIVAEKIELDDKTDALNAQIYYAEFILESLNKNLNTQH